MTLVPQPNVVPAAAHHSDRSPAISTTTDPAAASSGPHDAATSAAPARPPVLPVYTFPPSPEELQQIQDQFERSGYFVLKGVLPTDDLAATHKRLSQLANRWPDDLPNDERAMVLMDPNLIPQHMREIIDRDPTLRTIGEEDRAVLRGLEDKELKVRQFFRLAVHDEYFRGMVLDPKLLGVAEACVGPHIKVLQTMALVKPPGGMEKKPHQDNAYFGLEPHNVLGMWLALDEATPENGCMHVIPASHAKGIQAHHVPEGYAPTFAHAVWSLVEPPPDHAWAAIPLQAGDALFFSGDLIHFTPPNNTTTRRRGLQFHWASSECVPQEWGRYWSYRKAELHAKGDAGTEHAI